MILRWYLAFFALALCRPVLRYILFYFVLEYEGVVSVIKSAGVPCVKDVSDRSATVGGCEAPLNTPA